MTYISLFSSAGVGCYGFKKEGFDCIATNELIPRRLEVQKFNKKCRFETGYIDGDITDFKTKGLIKAELDFWKNNLNVNNLDVLIATPPCQGMSVANHKKTDREIIRNSLIVESIKIIKEVKPKFFVFENVPSFMKTVCTDVDGENKEVSEAIAFNLEKEYSFSSRVLNFKDYGSNSSRKRTLVIGVRREFADEISPLELFPDFKKEKTLRDVIGHLRSLNEMGEIDENDIYHFFRNYPERMRDWIIDIKEGESAFENADDNKKPHRVIEGKLVLNKNNNSDKYKRQCWDRVAPCVHTRNDQLASQNTIHPTDDRVFSIRELMLMMTVPEDFKWSDSDLLELNNLTMPQKRSYLKKEEIKIRQCLGEAVPTFIFQSIANKIKRFLNTPRLNQREINLLIENERLNEAENLVQFIKTNRITYSPSTLSRIAELANSKRSENAAYYTNKSLVTEMMNNLPELGSKGISILEPSVGVGNFIPLVIKKFEGNDICLDVVDIDEKSLSICKELLKCYEIPENAAIRFVKADFLLWKANCRYNLIIGNPPFKKLKQTDEMLKTYRELAVNKASNNICSFFLDKALDIADNVALVFPKFLLNTPEYQPSRDYIKKKRVECILDFGEKGFTGVLIETIAIFIRNKYKPSMTRVVSLHKDIHIAQKQKYIFDDAFPYWIIYRNSEFDSISEKLNFDSFNVFRDRQITKEQLNKDSGIRVLKARNIADDGRSIIDLDDYDAYISEENAKNLNVYSFYGRSDVFLTPNMTYRPRVIKKPAKTLVNGSVAILVPKHGCCPTKKQIDFFSSEEYRSFYGIARNYQTRSLNIDSCSVYFFGLLKEEF